MAKSGRKKVGGTIARYDPDYVDPHKDKRGWQPGRSPAIKGPNPFINYGLTQEMCLALANKKRKEIAEEFPWYNSDLKRRIRAGKRTWKVKDFHKWLWEYGIGHGKNRLPKDHPLREIGVSIDPYKVMKSLDKNAGLTQVERKLWEKTMKEMESYREQELEKTPIQDRPSTEPRKYKPRKPKPPLPPVAPAILGVASEASIASK